MSIIRDKVESVVDGLQSASHFLSASRAPVDAYSRLPTPPLLKQTFDDIRSAVEHGPPFSITDIPAYFDAIVHYGGTIDDRRYLLEKVLTLMARLPEDSPISLKLQQGVINILYKDLPHPPGSYLTLPPPRQPLALLTMTQHGDQRPRPVSYAYRPADGSNYNPFIPTIGMAGSPYARSVPALRRMSPAALPPAELVFDRLLKRDKFVEHPGGISSLFFAFADLIIHNIFHTDSSSPGYSINKSSSYLDLSPLYGTSQEAVNSVRLNDGTGKLKEDVFADPRLLGMPPAVCALAVIFNRNHNYVAQKILSINENGNLVDPPPKDENLRNAQDEEIFQRARLVNTAYFMQVILRDYVGAILGLARDGSSWRLDPLAESRDLDHQVSPRGQGNVVSVEFNLLYRWHATVSEPDTRWTEELFAEVLNGADPSMVSKAAFRQGAGKMLAASDKADITRWTFGGITRENGRFNDADLARILQNATEAPAGAFKARGTPEVLRIVEVLGIEQARAWGVCTLNEFRKFLGLNPYTTFQQWNPNHEIANAAEELYRDIDNLELYVGMQAEEAKERQPGAGLCPGFTISRAILADAVALSRGDRFMTVDFTPHNLTTWGYDDCQANTSDGAYGGMLTKLLFRHLSNEYSPSSAYAHFPFLVPKRMKEYTTERHDKIVSEYDWRRPDLSATATVVAKGYSDVKHILAEPGIFKSEVSQRLERLTLGVQLNIAPVEAVLARQTQLDRAANAFSEITRELISERTSQGDSPYLDVVGNVINFIPGRWLSEHILGLPIKIKENPRGSYTEQDIYTWLTNIANWVYCNTEKSNDWFLREQSLAAIREIEPILKGHLTRLTRGSGFTDAALRLVGNRNDHSDEFLTELVDATGSQSGNSALDGLVGSLLASVVPTAALFSQIIAQVVDYYLEPNMAERRGQIVRLARRGANAQVMPFIFEALRLNPPLSSVLLKAQSPTLYGNTTVAGHQYVIASIFDATHDSSTFPNPDTPNYARSPAHVECVLGLDRKGLLSQKLFERVAPVVLLEVFELKNLRRYPSPSGRMPRHQERANGVPHQFYTGLNGRVTPFPASLLVQFDQ